MTDRPRFRIKDVMGLTVALSIPLAMIAAGDALRMPGWILLIAMTIGGIAYLIDPRIT